MEYEEARIAARNADVLREIASLSGSEDL